MKVRFQADADFNHIILRALRRREPTIDFKASHAADLAGLTDPEVLTIAAGEERLLAVQRRHFHKIRPCAYDVEDFYVNQSLYQDFPGRAGR